MLLFEKRTSGLIISIIMLIYLFFFSYSLKQSEGFTSFMSSDNQEKKVNLIPIDDDGVSAVGTEFDNPILSNKKVPLYDSGGIRYNKYHDDHDMMGHGIYDPGNLAPPYNSHDPNSPPESIARLFAGPHPKVDPMSLSPERVENEYIPPPPPGPAPPPPAYIQETPFSSPRPTSFLNKDTDNNLNSSMSTINNPVASTPSDTPGNVFPI